MIVKFIKKYNRYEEGQEVELRGAELENAIKRGVVLEVKEKPKKADK